MADDTQLALYSTTVSDVGYVRANNQDSSFAGARLIAVADGMGGHAGGDTASTIAIRSLAHIERDEKRQGSVEEALTALETSILAAHDAIVGKAKNERTLSGMGTTVVAVVLVDGYWALAHIGDSRAYLLRGGQLIRVTKDHSYVQHLIDTGRITEAEAKNHPQRNVVMRVLGDFDIDPHPDLAVRRARPGDRWLLCSDGLCGVLTDETIRDVLSTVIDQEECAQQLVNMALKAGSTDNVSAVIGDATAVADIAEGTASFSEQIPLVGGAASASLEPIADIVDEPIASAPPLFGEQSPAARAAELERSGTADEDDTAVAAPQPASQGQRLAKPSSLRGESESQMPDTGEIPVVRKADGTVTSDPNDPAVSREIVRVNEDKKTLAKLHRRHVRITVASCIAAVLVLLGCAGWAGWTWSQSKYYLGEDDGVIVVYQGIPTNLFGMPLSHEVSRTEVDTQAFPQAWRDQLDAGITFDSYQEAKDHVDAIRKQATDLARQKADANAKDAATSGASGTSDANKSDANKSGANATDANKSDQNANNQNANSSNANAGDAQ